MIHLGDAAMGYRDEFRFAATLRQHVLSMADSFPNQPGVGLPEGHGRVRLEEERSW